MCQEGSGWCYLYAHYRLLISDVRELIATSFYQAEAYEEKNIIWKPGGDKLPLVTGAEAPGGLSVHGMHTEGKPAYYFFSSVHPLKTGSPFFDHFRCSLKKYRK